MQREIRRFLALGLTAVMLGIAAVAPLPLRSAEAGAGVAVAPVDAYQVYLAGMTFDPVTGAPQVNTALDASYQAGEQGLYLIQFKGPIYDRYKDAVTKAGAELGDYIPQNAFLAKMTPEAAAKVADLIFVRSVQVYKPAYKLATTLVTPEGQTVTQYKGNETSSLMLAAFNPAAARQLAENLKAQGAEVLGVDGQFVTVRVHLGQLTNMAKNNNVVSVQPMNQYQLFNGKAAGVMKVTEGWNSGLTGEGQIVAVADTGLDTGKNDSSLHPDFQGQVKSIYTWGRPGNASDTNGHGTHVAGSVLGNGSASNGANKGMAPKAKLVFQSVLDSQGGLGGIPGDLSQLFDQAYQAGARIHSNSWGTEVNGAYDDASRQVDSYVWSHPDMAILIAAGNSGQNQNTQQTAYQSIASPATAKNAITVGASENNRPEMGSYGDNINQIAAFSSRGYTADGRVKPDIVAPGSWVLSTKSSQAPDSNYWQVVNSRYAYDGGTSMATPLTAGTLALVRQWYVQQGVTAPAAALLKATLINGAQDMGVGFGGRDQGWGRVDLKNSVMPSAPRAMEFDNATHKLSTGESQRYSVSVTNNSTPLKVTVVWSDYPGSTAAGQTLVNDLDLVVTSPSGKVFNGNDFTQPYSDRTDHINNVEQVLIQNPEQGTYTFTVKGANVPQGPQPFAMVYSGAVGEASAPPADPSEGPAVSLTAPENGASVQGSVNVTANVDGAAAKVEFYVDGNLAATSQQKPYGFNWDTTAVADGQHTLQAKAYNAEGKAGVSQTVTVNVANGAQEPQPQPPAPPADPGQKTATVSGYASANNWGYAWRSHAMDVAAPGEVRLNLTWAQQNTDLDLYVVGPDGRLVGQAADLSNPESLTFQAKAGRYTFYVNAYSGASNYNLEVTYPTAAN